MTRCSLIPLLISLLASAWLLSTRTLHRWVLDLAGEAGYVLFLLLAMPVFAAVLLWSVVYVIRSRTGQRRRAVPPLLVNLLALVAFFAVPLRPLDLLDFRLNQAARTAVVRRIEAGELWNGSPSVQVAFLPRQYPRSISDGAGQRSVQVFRADGALHVVFFPHPGLRSDERSAFLYRADGRPPSLPDRYLPNAVAVEPLAERWWRVVSR